MGQVEVVSGDAARAHGSHAPIWWPVTRFLAVAGVLYLVVWLSDTTGFQHPDYVEPEPFPGSSFLDGWVRFDGNWYRLIAEQGYLYDPDSHSSVAFFPAYPLLMRALGWVIGDPVLAGILLTFAAGLGSAVLFHRWCAERLSPTAANTALLVLLLYPYSWYLYGAVYADALFLCATLGSFVLLERDRPVSAGFAAALAAATRVIGLAVLVGLVLRTLERRRAVSLPVLARVGVAPAGEPDEVEGATPSERAETGFVRFDMGRLRTADLGIGLGVLGLGAWSWFLWSRWGEPLLFARVQSSPPWNQTPGPHTWFKVDFVNSIRSYWDWGYNWSLIAHAAVVVIALLLLVPTARRFGWGYAGYALAVVALAVLGSKDFQGVGRYLLAAFPLFATAGDLLASRPRARFAVLAASALGLVVGASLYSRGWYVA